MPLIFDPLGTPSVVYFRDGEAVVELTGNGTTQAAATEIPAIAGTVIVVPTTSMNNDAFVLSASFAIGESVVMYGSANGYRVFAPPGELFIGGTSSSGDAIGSGSFNGYVLRRISATTWGIN